MRMRVGVEVMAKVIDSTYQTGFERGDSGILPSTEITGVPSELNGAKPLLVPWARKENDPEQVLSGSIPSR
jgi:hypothetical protein